MLGRLAGEEEFDLVVVGGGATGSGVALDAATRGLKVAMVERDDWGAGTSARSTKRRRTSSINLLLLSNGRRKKTLNVG